MPGNTISWPWMGPTIPCRPFVYGARVVPNGAFFIDVAGQYVKEEDGILHPQIGVTVQPNLCIRGMQQDFNFTKLNGITFS